MTQIAFLILNYKTYPDTIRVTYEILDGCSVNTKIIIVDNASPNESFSMLLKEFAGNELVDVVLSPKNGGYAKGNNFGLRYMKKYHPEYVCIINNDVHFTWDTIMQLEEWYPKLENPAFITPIQYLPGDKVADLLSLEVPDFIYDIRLYSILFHNKIHKYESNTQYKNIQQIGLVPGAFMFVKYGVFEDLGFFNECTFLFCEERFVAKEVQLKGLNNYAIIDQKYIHEHSKTISTEASKKKQQDLMMEGRILYIKKYGKFPSLKIKVLKLARMIYNIECLIISLIKK